MKALIAMSGGVDSSVAAYLTQQQGYECIGCTMKLHDDPAVARENSHTCCTLGKSVFVTAAPLRETAGVSPARCQGCQPPE